MRALVLVAALVGTAAAGQGQDLISAGAPPVNNQAISPSTVQANSVTTAFVDAGIVAIGGAGHQVTFSGGNWNFSGESLVVTDTGQIVQCNGNANPFYAPNGNFLSGVGSGSNAYSVTNNGARYDFGAGASDYASSDGTTVTFAGPLASSSTVTGSVVNGAQYNINGSFFMTNTAAAISSGFGTSPSVVTTRGSNFFKINVGTGGSATSGVITLGGTASTGWICNCDDLTQASTSGNKTIMTANSTTTCTVTNKVMSTGAATAWAASDILWCTAFPL